MNEAAIQQDVEVAKEEIVVGNTERNRILNDIAARAREERDRELAESGHDVVDTSGKEEAKPDQEQEEPEPETEKEVQVKEEEPETVRIKVDGEEREVPRDKVVDAGIRALQKESTADKRLEEATRLLREVQERIAPKQEKPQETPSQEWDDATVAYALEHGTEEQKAYAVKQLRGRETATPEEVEQKVMQKVLDTMDFKEASNWFVSEYKDIASDPYLMQLAAVSEDNLRRQGDTRSRRELYKDIGEDLRKWKGGTTNAQSFEEKKEQKSKVQTIPSASVKKMTEQVKQPKTTSEVIADMRKSRGQM